MLRTLSPILECIACLERAVSEEYFPLCAPCKLSLVGCPPICSRCVQIHAQEECLSPWTSSKELSSLTALYLLVGHGFRVMKAWKKRGGPYFHNLLLEKHTQIPQIDCIVPIPQSALRAWKLGGSPALRISQKISRETKTPVISALRLEGHSSRPQAQLKKAERYSSQNPFALQVTANIAGQDILLVDDFTTTGRTLKRAAQVLIRGGARSVHAFCLGYRPSLIQDHAELLHRCNGSKPICDKMNGRPLPNHGEELTDF